MKALALVTFALDLLCQSVSVSASGSVGGGGGYIDYGPQPEDLNGSNFTYPWPVKLYRFTSQFQELEMAFMDVQPGFRNGTNATIGSDKVALLLHGKNFCAATWEGTITNLTSQGYRVVAVDQIGFCKSTKPEYYQFSFQQLALNTNSLLQALGIYNVTVIGHSMGGMLASRYTLMYPANVTDLVMVDPLGLEDWKAVGVPYETIDLIWKTENASNYTSIREYQQVTYYVNTWDVAYDVWVNMLVNIYWGSKRAQFVFDQALVTDMIITQPTIYEYPMIQPRTLLIIGDKDNTAIGKAWSPPAVQAVIGNYSVIGPAAATLIPNSLLVQFPDLGHAPQIEAPDRFHDALLGWLLSA